MTATSTASQLHRIYAFSFFWGFLLIIPVLVPFQQSFGLSMRDVFIVQVLFGMTVAVLEVPSGYLCDLWGRKPTLILGAAINAVGFTYLFFCESFIDFVLAEVLVGVAYSLVSGADVAMLYDSMGEHGKDRSKFKAATANLQLVQVTAESGAAIVAGLIAIYSLPLVFLVQAFVSWLPLVLSLRFREPQYQRMESGQHIENFRLVFRHVFRGETFLRLVILNLVVWSLSTFCAVWIFQKYWEENAIPLGWFGFIWAAYNLTVGLVGKRVHALEDRFGPVPILLTIAILPVVGYLVLGAIGGWLGVLAGFTFQITRGLAQVILRDALNWRVPAEFRATANSMSSLLFRLGFCVLGPAIGISIDRFGLSRTFFSLAAVFSVAAVLAMVPLIREVRRVAPERIPEVR